MNKRIEKREAGWGKGARQRGAALVFALLLLLVMTVLGVASIGNSVLEERMSGNFHQSTSALQSAEIGLRVAENWVAGITRGNLESDGWFLAGAAGKKGLYSTQAAPADAVCKGVAGCGFQPTDKDHWCDSSDDDCPLPKGYVTLGTNDLGTGQLPAIHQDMVDQQPRFIIEYIGRSGELVGNLALGAQAQPDIRRYAFRITAIGWGRDPNARHVLQSHFLVPL